MYNKSQKTFFELGDDNWTPPPKPSGVTAEDKHVATLEAMQQYAKPPQKNLEDLSIEYSVDRKTKISMVLCPEWDPAFVPYNIAKLAGALKSAGYFCKCYDLNVESYYKYNQDKQNNLLNNKIDYFPWDPMRDWHWIGDKYYNELHEYIEPILEDCAQKIVYEDEADVVGFTLYYCNEEPSKWLANRIKELNPKIKIVVGGPHTHSSHYYGDKIFDIVVNGEGEKSLLSILERLESENEIIATDSLPNTGVPVIRQPEKEITNLSTMPRPYYGDFDFKKYKFPNGALCEISRGCVAKCVFCDETHFWKYRQRTAISTLEEIEHMYYEHGVNVFWFIDSLVNGNLNELRAFVKGVAAKGLEINWTGYARCNGKMDLEYFKDLKAGGCSLLNYGIESGSQKVLDDMDKKVTVEEMEQNFIDGEKVGIGAMTNWIVGFPSEGPKEFEDTLTFLWRIKDKKLEAIAQGPGFNVGVDTIVGQNFDRFNLQDHYYFDHWITKDFKHSIMHKMIKMKCFSIFTDYLPTKYSCAKPHRPELAKRHYKIRFDNPNKEKQVEYNYEDFDYEIIKPGLGNFADSVINVIWPFLRILWRTRGGYQLHLIFDKELDRQEWGERGSAPLDAVYNFIIDDSGNWQADFSFDYQQPKYTDWNDEKIDMGNGEYRIEPDTMGPVWSLMEFSQHTSNSVVRARKLAWKGDESKKHRDPHNAFDIEEFIRKKEFFHKNRDLDLSFSFDWQGNGSWKK